MRKLLLAMFMACGLSLPALAELPALGVQPTFFGDQKRIACDTLDQLKQIYSAGKDNASLIRSKVIELAQETNERGEAACVVASYANVSVLGVKYLGPINNPVNDAELGVYAVHVDLSPYAPDPIDFWIFYPDLQNAQTAPSGIPPSGRVGNYRFIVLEEPVFRRKDFL